MRAIRDDAESTNIAKTTTTRNFRTHYARRTNHKKLNVPVFMKLACLLLRC